MRRHRMYFLHCANRILTPVIDLAFALTLAVVVWSVIEAFFNILSS